MLKRCVQVLIGHLRRILGIEQLIRYQQRQIEALLEIGATGVQLDAVLWSLGDLEG